MSNERYINYVLNEMIERTDFNSVEMTHDQVLPPWMKQINIYVTVCNKYFETMNFN